MRRKKLRRRIVRIVLLGFLLSTLFWVDFRALGERLSVFFDKKPAEEAAQEKMQVSLKPSEKELLPKVTAFLRNEGDLIPGGEAEIIGIIDLNNNGQWEIVTSAESGGAYTSLFAVLQYTGGKVNYVNLIDREGQKKKASFADGSSVRHANAFKIFNDSTNKAYVQLSGESDETGENWKWDIAAYTWNGKAFAYNPVLSEKILKEDPQKVFQKEDYLNELFKSKQDGADRN